MPLLLNGPKQHQTVHAPPGRPSHSCETQWHQGQVRRHGDRRIVDELQFWQAGRQRRAGGARVKVMMVACTTICSKLKFGIGCPEKATPPSTKEQPDPLKEARPPCPSQAGCGSPSLKKLTLAL